MTGAASAERGRRARVRRLREGGRQGGGAAARLKLAAFAALLALLGAPGAAAEPLRAALARAYAGNPQLNAERARQRADDEAVPQALSGYRPQVGAVVSPGLEVARDALSRRERRQAIEAAVEAAGTDPAARRAAALAAKRETRPQTSTSAGIAGQVTVSQTLFNGGRTAAQVGGAESQVLAGREVLRGVEQDVLLAAATAYLDVVLARANVALQRSSITFLDEIVRQARKRFETGESAPTDLAQAESRRARGGADLAQAEANLATARAAYRVATGAEPDRLPDTFAPEAAFTRSVERLLPTRIEAAVSVGQREHPSIRAAVHAIDAAVFAERVAASAFYPTVAVQGSASPSIGAAGGSTGSGAQGSGAFDAGSSGLGLQVNANLYDGGATAAAVRQAKEQIAQSRHDLETARDQVRADVTTTLGIYEAAGAAIAAGEVAVQANEIALAGVQREQLEGQRTVLEVLNAQQELLGARTRLAQAQRDRIVGAYALLAAVGRLSATHIGVTRTEYRPEAHYRQVRDLWGGTRTPDGR